MEDPTLFFRIPKHLNHGKRIVGLPRDEVLPAFIVFAVFFIAKHQIVGFILAATWFLLLRRIKVQYGHNIIALSIYWWGNPQINRRFFKRTPASERRYWLS